jgi:hypothetical protein
MSGGREMPSREGKARRGRDVGFRGVKIEKRRGADSQGGGRMEVTRGDRAKTKGRRAAVKGRRREEGSGRRRKETGRGGVDHLI